MLRTIKKFQVLSTCAKVRDVRQNKGSILKASVDYIKLLRRDKEKRSAVEERCKKLEQNHRRALLKIQVPCCLFTILRFPKNRIIASYHFKSLINQDLLMDRCPPNISFCHQLLLRCSFKRLIGAVFCLQSTSDSSSESFKDHPEINSMMSILWQEYEQRLAGLGVPVESASWRSATSDELANINNVNNVKEGSQVEAAKRQPGVESSDSPTTGILLEGEDSNNTTDSSPVSSTGDQDDMET